MARNGEASPVRYGGRQCGMGKQGRAVVDGLPGSCIDEHDIRRGGDDRLQAHHTSTCAAKNLLVEREAHLCQHLA